MQKIENNKCGFEKKSKKSAKNQKKKHVDKNKETRKTVENIRTNKKTYIQCTNYLKKVNVLQSLKIEIFFKTIKNTGLICEEQMCRESRKYIKQIICSEKTFNV